MITPSRPLLRVFPPHDVSRQLACFGHSQLSLAPGLFVCFCLVLYTLAVIDCSAVHLATFINIPKVSMRRTKKTRQILETSNFLKTPFPGPDIREWLRFNAPPWERSDSFTCHFDLQLDFSPNSTWPVTSRSTCRADSSLCIFGCRACRTARLDTLVSTRSICQTCRV